MSRVTNAAFRFRDARGWSFLTIPAMAVALVCFSFQSSAQHSASTSDETKSAFSPATSLKSSPTIGDNFSRAAVVGQERSRPVSRVRNNPNFLICLAPGITTTDLGCYGSTNNSTPNIDRLASNGWLFDQFYGVAGESAANFQSILTGNVDVSFLPGGWNRMRSNSWTIGSVLKQAGYATALFGVWGQGAPGSSPTGQGFDEWFGFLEQTNSLDPYPEELWRNNGKIILSKNQGGSRGILANDYFTIAAGNFMKQKQRTPFLCFVNFAELRLHGSTNSPRASMENSAQMDKATYLRMVDTALGRLVNAVKELKLETETIILFATLGRGLDKQATSGNPGLKSSTSILGAESLDELAGLPPRLACVMKTGTTISTPGKIRNLCWTPDLFTTLGQLAGLGSTGTAVSKSLVEVAQGKQLADERALIWSFGTEKNPSKMVLHGPWKWILKSQREEELFNIVADPLQKTNRSSLDPALSAKMRLLGK